MSDEKQPNKINRAQYLGILFHIIIIVSALYAVYAEFKKRVKTSLPDITLEDIHFQNGDTIDPVSGIDEFATNFQVIPNSNKVILEHRIIPPFDTNPSKLMAWYRADTKVIRYEILNIKTGQIEWHIDLHEIGEFLKLGYEYYDYQTAFIENRSTYLLVKYSTKQMLPVFPWLPSFLKMEKDGADYWLVRDDGKLFKLRENEKYSGLKNFYGNRFLESHSQKSSEGQQLVEYEINNHKDSKRHSWKPSFYPVRYYRIADGVAANMQMESDFWLFVNRDSKTFIRRFPRKDFIEFAEHYYTTTEEIHEKYQFTYNRNRNALQPKHILKLKRTNDETNENIQKRRNHRAKMLMFVDFIPLTPPQKKPVYVLLNLPNNPIFSLNTHQLRTGTLFDIFEFIGDCNVHRPFTVVNDGKTVLFHFKNRYSTSNQDLPMIKQPVSFYSHYYAADIEDGSFANWRKIEVTNPTLFSFKQMSTIQTKDGYFAYLSGKQIWKMKWDGTEPELIYQFQ